MIFALSTLYNLQRPKTSPLIGKEIVYCNLNNANSVYYDAISQSLLSDVVIHATIIIIFYLNLFFLLIDDGHINLNIAILLIQIQT